MKEFSKVRANLKRHNRVNILSSKHSYRPMGARVEAQLFYNTPFFPGLQHIYL